MKLSDNCRWDGMPSLKKDFWKTYKHEHTQGFENYVAPLVGIEVEAENLANQDYSVPSPWRIAEDGSLRNGGRELISFPTAPDCVESLIKMLFERLPKDTHFSPRTSVHVHMNCRDLDYMQVYNIVILYQAFEDLLYDFAGKERKKSIFCVPIGNTNYYRDFKHYMVRDSLYRWSKYTGLNLAPLGNYGTIEFRHLRGTRDISTIYTWLHLLYRLYGYAISSNTQVLESTIIKHSNDGQVLNFGREVFGNMFEVLRSQAYEKKMDEDLSISKLFITGKV